VSTLQSWSQASKIRLLSRFEGIDLVLLVTVLILLSVGLIMVYSASYIFAAERTGDGYYFIKRQLGFSVLGLTFLAFFSMFDFRRLNWLGYPLVILSTILLLIVLIPGVGTKVGGAQRWFRIGSLGFQPGEIFKLSVIFFMATRMSRKFDRVSSFVAGTLGNLVVLLPGILLLLIQPDLGSTIITVAVVLSLMTVSNVPLRYLMGLILVGSITFAGLIMSTPYRLARFTAFLDPWEDPMGSGFQVLQSLVGLTNGGTFGVGLGNGKEKLFFLPESHNDFIFAVIGEELGFSGVALIILLFSVVLFRGFKISKSLLIKREMFSALLSIGVTVLILSQAFTNMAVVLGLLPTKGLNLPFLSYGGTSLVVNLAAIGVLLSLSRYCNNESIS